MFMNYTNVKREFKHDTLNFELYRIKAFYLNELLLKKVQHILNLAIITEKHWEPNLPSSHLFGNEFWMNIIQIDATKIYNFLVTIVQSIGSVVQ